MPTNDNHAATRTPTLPMPDAHGHAALLLVESLIHGLLERSIISTGDAIEIIESADSVQARSPKRRTVRVRQCGAPTRYCPRSRNR